MYLNECTNEEALDIIAELLGPVAEIASSDEVQKAVKSNKPKLVIAGLAIKANKPAIMDILRIASGNPDYKKNAVGILADVVEILNVPELANLFT